MEHFKSKKKSFPSRVISLLVVLAIILTSLNVMYIPDQAEAASKKTVAVQSGEKKKIEKFLDKNISEYLNQCCASLVNGDELKMNSLYFKFDKKRKNLIDKRKKSVIIKHVLKIPKQLYLHNTQLEGG